MKRLIALLLVLCMTMTLVLIDVFAAYIGQEADTIENVSGQLPEEGCPETPTEENYPDTPSLSLSSRKNCLRLHRKNLRRRLRRIRVQFRH